MIESVARALAVEPETTPEEKERAVQVIVLETKFAEMIARVQSVQSDLAAIFLENSVLSENTTPRTAEKLDTVLVGLVMDLQDLSTRHRT